MARQKEKVGHKDLVGGGQTILHSHADGGNGAAIKAGTITTSGSGIASVVFGTAFADVDYAIILTCQHPADTAIAMFENKAVGGFDILTKNDQGQNEPTVVVDWLATPYSNP